MPEVILIPLDGSIQGESALHYVEGLISRLAPRENVEAILFHVITKSTQAFDINNGQMTIRTRHTEYQLEQMKVEAMEYLDYVAEGLISKGVTVLFRVTVGLDPAEEIIKAADEVNADLLVMSMHRKVCISRSVLGSVTNKVFREGRVPLLVVRTWKDVTNTCQPAPRDERVRGLALSAAHPGSTV